MNDEKYFMITENAKNYPDQPWKNSGDTDYLMYGVPNDEGIELMSMYDAFAFVSSNDPSSLIAYKIPEEIYNLLQDPEYAEEYGIEMKDEYHIDYRGQNLL